MNLQFDNAGNLYLDHNVGILRRSIRNRQVGSIERSQLQDSGCRGSELER